MSAVWSFFVLCFAAVVGQYRKHKLPTEPKGIGEKLLFRNAMHFVDTIIIFLKSLTLLLCHGIIEANLGYDL